MKKRVLITMAASATLLLAGCGNDQKKIKISQYRYLLKRKQINLTHKVMTPQCQSIVQYMMH